MSDPIVAGTHYDDFKGTVALDRNTHPTKGADPLRLAADLLGDELPKGYSPVGFGVTVIGGGGHDYFLTVYAVDAEVVLAGSGKDLHEYLRGRDEVPVFEFSRSVEPAELVDLLLRGVKEFKMVVWLRELEGKTLRLLTDN